MWQCWLKLCFWMIAPNRKCRANFPKRGIRKMCCLFYSLWFWARCCLHISNWTLRPSDFPGVCNLQISLSFLNKAKVSTKGQFLKWNGIKSALLSLNMEMYDNRFFFKDGGFIKRQQRYVIIFIQSSGFSKLSWNFWPWPDTEHKPSDCWSLKSLSCSARFDLEIKSIG